MDHYCTGQFEMDTGALLPLVKMSPFLKGVFPCSGVLWVGKQSCHPDTLWE